MCRRGRRGRRGWLVGSVSGKSRLHFGLERGTIIGVYEIVVDGVVVLGVGVGCLVSSSSGGRHHCCHFRCFSVAV